jgi:hypothetical protein
MPRPAGIEYQELGPGIVTFASVWVSPSMLRLREDAADRLATVVPSHGMASI